MSTSTESLAQKWLRQNVQAYAFKDAVYSHVDAVLTQFNTIRPKTDVYTYDDGRTQLLLCLHGLLPIAYRGASYNIPIAVWIPRDYPRQPPITYVVPTSDMLVRSGKYVDVSGRCNIEYLQNWERKSEGCNLIILLEVMQQHFSRDPPVYAKPKTANNQQSQPQSELLHPGTGSPAYAARPPPPLPGTSTPTPLSTPTPMVSSRNDDRPPLPLKPGQQASSATPPVFSSTSTPPDVNHRPPATYATAMKPPPPLPRHPPGDPGLPQYRNSPAPLPPYNVVHDRGLSSGVSVTGSSATFNTQSHALSPSYTPGRRMSSEIEQNRTSIPPYSPPSSTPVTASPTRPPPPPPPPPVTISHGPPHPPPPPQLPTSPFRASLPLSPPPAPPLPVNPNQSISPQATGPISTQTSYSVHPWPPPAPVPTAYSPANVPASIPRPTPSIPPPDLLDAEDDLSAPSNPQVPAPAPPRPPNPELLRLHDSVHAKLSSELASLRQAMALDAERLRANQTDLLAGEPAIRDEMARLEAVRDVCRGVGERMKTVVEQATSNVADLKRRGDPSVDELVCSTTIVHDQLINLVAEDNAIEDTIYHLHRALNAGRIDLERFLRTTRILAEEQFMKRALIEKIQGGIPMGTESSLHVRPEWA